MTRTCLFITNGLGLGNSTRCYAVMEHLVEQGFRIHVLTSGNGLTFFQHKSCIDSLTQTGSFYYSSANGVISGWSTLKSIKNLLSIAKTKRADLSALLDRIQPDVAVIDSEYALAPLRMRRIPIIAINSSEIVVSQYLKQKTKPANVRSHFWFVGFFDYLFHKHFCDLILSPFPLKTKTRSAKFRRVGLIARQAILQHARKPDDVSFPSPRSLQTVIFMLSGSVHASRISFPQDLPFKIEVVGVPGESRQNLIYHGRQMDNVDLLRRADALVVNGGYSAVSEAFVLGRPVFVVPVPGHAEQFVNAALVRDLGLGFVATETNVVSRLLEMFEQNRWVGRKPLPAAFEIDGARESAGLIASFVEAFKYSRSPSPQRLTAAESS